MKNVTIKKYRKPDATSALAADHFYSVHLGNGTTKLFGSKRECLAFLAETNRFLNLKLHECNYIFCDVFAEYRQNWFYFEHNKPSMSENLTHAERKCELAIDSIKQAFDMLVTRGNWENGNEFMFMHFNNILENMSEICQTLIGLQKKKSNGVDVARLEILKQRIAFTSSSLVNYNKSVEMEMLKTPPQHIRKISSVKLAQV